MELLDSRLAYAGRGVEVQIRHYRREDGTEEARLAAAEWTDELDETLPRIRDASTLIALMALRDRPAGTTS